jgi:Cu/Ag efflux protein CusF
MKLSKRLVFSLLAAIAVPVYSQDRAQAPAPGAAKPAASAAAATSPMARGEILKVYAKEKKVLLKHGPIASLGMGPMTMEYGLADPKGLASIKAGDKVLFLADQVKGST